MFGTRNRSTQMVGAVFVAGSMVLGLTACDGSGSDGVKVGLITKTDSNPYFVNLREAAKAQADKDGAELIALAGAFDGDNEGQVAAIENMVGQGVKGILTTPNSSTGVLDAIKKARDAGVIVIALDTATDPEDAVDATCATDNKAAGVSQGKWVKAALGGKAPQVVMLDGTHAAYRVRVVDAAAGTTRAVPVSAVSVVESTGDRSVVSLDAVNSDASPPDGLADVVAGADVVLVDGHLPLLARAAAHAANSRSAPLVVDAGRWKPAMDHVIHHATDMLCSNYFRIPGAEDSTSTAAALVRSGVHTVITTHGGEPVQWWSAGHSGSVPVEAVVVVDTLGAGDAFHGAYSYFTVQTGDVAERVDRSARVAALGCSVIGPRAWLSELPSLQGRKRER